MQRWVKLPNGSFIDANRIAYIGRVEAYPLLDDIEGEPAGPLYALTIGTDVHKESQMTVTARREEISNLVRTLLGQAPA